MKCAEEAGLWIQKVDELLLAAECRGSNRE